MEALEFPKGAGSRSERPTELLCVTVSDAVAERIEEACREWVLRVSYDVTYDDDDGESRSSDVRYKELVRSNIVVDQGRPIGVLLTHRIHYHNSNCTDTHLYILYFRDAPDYDLMLEGARSGNHYVEGTAFYSLSRRDELGPHTKVDTATTQFIPVPDVY